MAGRPKTAGRMIIGITGKRLSGKNTVAEHLREKYRFRVLCFTEDLLKPILEKRKEPVNRRSLIALGMEIRKERKGNDALASLLARKISAGRDYAIAGMRFPEEVSLFRERFGKDFILMAVEASERTRFRRAKASMRFKEVGSMRDFLEVEKLPTERIIPKTMKLADFSVRNEGKLEGLKKEVDGIMREILDRNK